MKNDLQSAIERLDAWIEQENFRGWDPFDALNSPLLKRLTFGNRRMGQLWVQLFKRSPINLRSVFGVPKGYNPKSMGLFLASYWRKYLLTGSTDYLQQVNFFADWLRANVSQGYSGACWGYNFDWPNRGFFAPRGTPTIVNTAFIGLAFVDLVTLPKRGLSPKWDYDPLQIAVSACRFILDDLARTCPATDQICFSYTPLDQRFVHNANVMGALLLAEVAALASDSQMAKTALAAARYTVRCQHPDGSWSYGEGRADHWVDNFHTGFVLVGLRRIGQAIGSTEFHRAARRGYSYWKEHFFTREGAPKYYPDRVHPIDIHSAAQAILTLLTFSKEDPEAPRLASEIAVWSIQNMQVPQGYFHYQVYPAYRIRIPYMRWSQAWMQRAFAELAWSGAA